MTTVTSNARAADARRTLAFLAIPLGADFHALPSIQVEGLLECARLERYRQPKNANGSRALYYHERLQRLAARDACCARCGDVLGFTGTGKLRPCALCMLAAREDK